MRTILTVAIVASLGAPALAQDVHSTIGALVRTQVAELVERDLERDAQQRERDLERAAQERERAAEQREREQERAAEQREREQERAAEQRERARERAQQQRQGGNVQTERTTRTVSVGSNGEIDVANVSGDIVIARGSGSDATIEIVKSARGRTDADARELLKLVQVDITARGNRAEIKTRYPPSEELRRNNRRNASVNVAITITAPPGVGVRARSISGAVSAKDIKGEVSLESVSGSIQVMNGGRVAAAKSISGDVEVIGTDSEGVIEASSASGSIILRQVKARALDAGSISGNVVMEDVESPRVEAQTVSGNVRLSGNLARGGRYELTSHSGSVEVAVAGGTGFEVDATSFSGSVRSDFPVKARGSGAEGRRPQALRGVYGDGSAVLDLTTFSGSIVISKR